VEVAELFPGSEDPF